MPSRIDYKAPKIKIGLDSSRNMTKRLKMAHKRKKGYCYKVQKVKGKAEKA